MVSNERNAKPFRPFNLSEFARAADILHDNNQIGLAISLIEVTFFLSDLSQNEKLRGEDNVVWLSRK